MRSSSPKKRNRTRGAGLGIAAIFGLLALIIVWTFLRGQPVQVNISPVFSARTVNRLQDGLPVLGTTQRMTMAFLDPSCGHCRDYWPVFKRFIERTPAGTAIRIEAFVGGSASRAAGAAAWCADEQGQYYPYLDGLMQISPDEFGIEGFSALSDALKMNRSRFIDCLNQGRGLARQQRSEAITAEGNINAVPVVVYTLDSGSTWNYPADLGGAEITEGGPDPMDLERVFQ